MKTIAILIVSKCLPDGTNPPDGNNDSLVKWLNEHAAYTRVVSTKHESWDDGETIARRLAQQL